MPQMRRENLTMDGTATSGSAEAEQSKGGFARETARRFTALSFCRADMLFELDHELAIVFAAGTMKQIMGTSPQAMHGRSFVDLIDPGSQALIDELLRTAGVDGRIDDVSVDIRLPKDRTAKAVLAGYREPDFDGHFFLAVKIAPRHIADHHNHDKDRDPATGLMSSDAFTAASADRIKSIGDAGRKANITLLKIDNVEQLNNGLSDDDRAKVMDRIGTTIRERSLGSDTAGRIDDQNFSFLHTDETDVSQIETDISDAVAEVHPSGMRPSTTSLTLEAGGDDVSAEKIAKALTFTMREFCDNPEELAGKNMWDVVKERMSGTVKTIEIFKKVCARGSFDLVFMPICDLSTGKVHHFEALTRFPKNGNYDGSPYKLITMAEEVGIIEDFDFVVATKAIAKLAEFKGRSMPPLAINLSGHSVSSPQFAERLHALFDRYPGLARSLMLEITESAKIHDLVAVNAVIQGFRKKGFHVALDDFGAGAASFDYLNAFDVDTVKFDGPVVRRAFQTSKGRAFLSSMSNLCRETGIETIAEMVEDEPLAIFLKDCGIGYGQGYFFGKPTGDPFTFL